MNLTFAEAARQYIENQELEDGRGIPAKQKKGFAKTGCFRWGLRTGTCFG